MPVLASTITFDQNWHHLYSSSAGGKVPSNATQIRVILPMEPWNMHENVQKFEWNLLGGKFYVTTYYTLSHSMVKSACLDDVFPEIFELEASPVVQSLSVAKRYNLWYLQILISVHAWANLLKNVMQEERKACCHVATALLSRLELINFGSYPS